MKMRPQPGLYDYSFFSGGTAGAGAGGAAGVAVGGAGVGVVTGVAVTGAGKVTAPGASCQWPCSGDHTFPGGASPGGCGTPVDCCGAGKVAAGTMDGTAND